MQMRARFSPAIFTTLFMAWAWLLPLAADAESLFLICDYPVASTRTTNDSMILVPREIEIDQSQGTVSWNGNVREVPAKVEDTRISFKYQGYEYSLSRITGEIRFHNPEALKKWNSYRDETVINLMMQGLSAAAAEREVDTLGRDEFSTREHVG